MEDTTKEMNNDQLLRLIYERQLKYETKLEALEKKIDARWYDTQPSVQNISLQMEQMEARLNARMDQIRVDLEQKIEDVRAELYQKAEEHRLELRNVTRQFETVAVSYVEMRSNTRDYDLRLHALERKLAA